MSNLRRLLLAQAQVTPNYTEKEYLQTDGVAYFNTGIVADQNTEVELDYLQTDVGTTFSIFGARVAFQNNQFEFRTTGQKFYANLNADSTWYSLLNTKCKYTAKKINSNTQIEIIHRNFGTQEIIRSVIYTITAFNTANHMFVFALNNNGVVALKSPTGNRMYAMKIWQSGVLVRDYVARLDSNGVACAYDKVNGTYNYTPVGTFTTN